ncbi:MAG: DUF4124 domain-containing protein [Xanthomonadales bacterium]|nr:DUF4124 domain-containing protein [Xanthomonadales bacterium]
MSAACTQVLATEIYHWVDENGVSHYSQSAQAGSPDGVKTMTLDDTAPPDYDPDEDRYGVAAQAERMTLLRKEMDEKREAERDRRRNAAAQQPVVRQSYPVNSGYGPFWRPPYRPVPPVEPRPPVPEPYPTSTLKPPGVPPD